jgi:hypothetical protein
VSEYLHSGWHELFIPVTSGGERSFMRIWIEMADVVPMLRELDRIYGSEDHPYALRPEEIPDAQRKLLELVTEHAIAHPERVHRAAAPRKLGSELAERFGVGRSQYPLDYPTPIDQVDLGPAQLMFALPFILDREQIPLGGEL